MVTAAPTLVMDSTGLNTQDASEVQLDAPCWMLTIIHHRERALLGKRLVVDADVEIGRGSTCFGVAGVFDDHRISRDHAVLSPSDAALELADRGSRNGTFVNGARVKAAALSVGDVVAFGKVLLLVGRAPALFPLHSEGGLVGASHAYALARAQIDKLAGHATGVLFFGPPGAGKDAFAELLHHQSKRPGKLVPVVCGALDESALHSELFGHERGAFAGATRCRRGLIEAAAGGTLLLDAVDDASHKLQLLLLRFLETGRIRRLGSNDDIVVDVRVVATAKEPLDRLVEDGTLRREFADRLRGLEIHVPPLAERLEDIALLADHFVQRFAGPEARLHDKLVLHLQRRAWPGNARELEALIDLAVIEAERAELIELPSRLEGGPSPANGEGGLAYVFAANGEWFRSPDGERTDLRDRSTLVRILGALAARRRSAPGSALSVPELLEVGWPGERVEPRSGANRVYVALTTLRRLGLRDILLRERDGYLLAPAAAIEVARD